MVLTFKAVNMNYTCLIVGGFMIVFTAWWFVVRTEYTARMLKARDKNDATMAQVILEDNKQ